MTARLSCADGAAREAVALLLLAFWPSGRPVRSTSAGSKVGCPAGPCLSRIADHFSLVRTHFPGGHPQRASHWATLPRAAPGRHRCRGFLGRNDTRKAPGSSGQRPRVSAVAGQLQRPRVPADGPLIRSPPGQTRGVQSASRKRGSGTRRSRSDSWKSRKRSPLGSSGRARRGWDRPGRRPRRWRAAAPRRCRDVRWTTAMACAFLT